MLKKFALVVLSILLVVPYNCYASQISAQSAVVMDADTGVIIYEKNAYEPLTMASTTKIMTAIIALENGDFEFSVEIKPEMLCEGSSLGLKEGDVVTFYDLIVGMMLSSGNDAANAIAYVLGGSIEGFAEMMNNKANSIGMNDSFFVTPSGLDEGNHHSTAYDMALLTRYAIDNESFCNIVSQKSAVITISGHEQTIYNHNKLLSNDGFFGVKTGYTKKSGRCLVSTKNYNNARLICVTLNAPNDWDDHIKLMKECEGKYIQNTISNRLLINAVGSQVDSVTCSYNGDVYAVSELEIKLYYYPFIYAPIKMGDIVGYANVYSNNTLIERLPIEADEDLTYAKQE